MSFRKTCIKGWSKIRDLNLEEFGNVLFIDDELQVAEKDENFYSSTLLNLELVFVKEKVLQR